VRTPGVGCIRLEQVGFARIAVDVDGGRLRAVLTVCSKD